MHKKAWISPKITIKNSRVDGKGMFANCDIKKGEKLVVFGGDYENKQNIGKYRKLGKLIMHWDEDLFSYEDRGDDDEYFINHSCDSNLWMIDTFTLVAKRNIQLGEELTADYVLWEADEDFVSSWECSCKSPFCRKRITGKDWRDSELQQRYKGHFSPLINKRIGEFNS